MENIAEALRMAAGVLLAVLLISLIIYIFQTLNQVEDERQQQILITQVTEFNKQFTAYEKSQMYGTDIMSVVSLALNNNRDLNGERAARPDGRFHEDLDGSVNIKVWIKNDSVKSRTTKITQHPTYPLDDPEREKKEFLNERDYFLGCYDASGYLTLTNLNAVEKLQDMIIDKTSVEVKRKVLDGGATVITEIEDNIGLEDFKKTVFTCEDVKYSQTGKIYEMSFRAVETD